MLVSLVRSALVLCVAVACAAPSAFAQPIRIAFESGGSSVSGGISGREECSDDPVLCNRYLQGVSAETGIPGQQFSQLTFRFDGARTCQLAAPPASSSSGQSYRDWNVCPSGPLRRPYSLTASDTPGADYGLKRLRICTDDSGELAGAEARFFKSPQLPRNGPGQDVVTRSFEREGCTDWEEWSVCPAGMAASSMTLYTRTLGPDGLGGAGVSGVELKCRPVEVYNPRSR